ncbi:MAG: hypothetical protein J6Y37_08630, partial [Paludibacteraceae bacterium]|nr:hypothetical protein [Paludibacteraceae bacterium]
EWYFTVIGDVQIIDGKVEWDESELKYGKETKHRESWNVVRYDDEEGYWFDGMYFKDALSGLKSGIKKATKMFKEYNPDWDDDERAYSKFMGSMDAE